MDLLNNRELSTEMQMLLKNKTDGFAYRERREEEWRENYTLYRGKVTINRLTQRQSVNIPLLKTNIRSMLKDIDDMPILYFENLDNNKQAEVFKNEYWKDTMDFNRTELQDIVDKKQVCIFGRSFDQWQVINGKVVMNITDPEDILVSRYTNSYDIHSSRYLIHTNIFIPLSVLERDEKYEKSAIRELKEYFISQDGIDKSQQNERILQEKNKKMEDMGFDKVNDPILGEKYVAITLHFVFRAEDEDEEEQIYLYVEAEDRVLLMKKKLEEVIGETEDHFFRNHYPYCTWADDLEMQDFWCDAVADIIRPNNKVLNAWYSQLVENRTLRNLNMNLFDSSLEGWAPQTWEPRAWGMYGVPLNGVNKIDNVFKPLPVAELSESLDEIMFVVQMSEKATATTATQQGVAEQKQITLGEVQLALGEAKERIKGMSKFYTQAWKDRALMFIKLIEASGDKLNDIKIYNKGKNSDNIYQREIGVKDWKSKLGYRFKIWSQDEKNTDNTRILEKVNAAKVNMPDNPKVDEIFKRKLLEFADITPDDINEAMRFEEEKRTAQQQSLQNQPPTLQNQPQALQLQGNKPLVQQ